MERSGYIARARRAWRAHAYVRHMRAGLPLAAMGHKSPIFLRGPAVRGVCLCDECVRPLTCW